MSLKFSIIIPTYNRQQDLTRCLQRVYLGINDPSECEIIVSDDGHDLKLESHLSNLFPKVIYQKGPQRGPAANRNSAASMASGRWIIFLDDDCIPDQDLVPSYSTAINEYPNSLLFEGRIYTADSRYSLADFSPVNETGGYLWACNFCIQAELFKSLGGFDETFPHPAMEDVDLCYRLKQKGIYPQFIWKAAVCHPWRPIGNIRTLLNQQSAALIYLRLHPEERARMTPGFYFRHALRNFVNNTLRDSLRLRFRGIHKALLEHCIHIFTGLRIMISNFESKSSK